MNILHKIQIKEKTKGVGYKELAKKIGISISTYFEVKAGRKTPQIYTISKIVDYARSIGIECTIEEAQMSFVKKEEENEN